MLENDGQCGLALIGHRHLRARGSLSLSICDFTVAKNYYSMSYRDSQPSHLFFDFLFFEYT